jgi:hypothetical protein
MNYNSGELLAGFLAPLDLMDVDIIVDTNT